MTILEARRWLILFTLGALGLLGAFLILSPSLGYPLEIAESIQLFELVCPLMLGYLGSATAFIISPPDEDLVLPQKTRGLVGILVRGPIVTISIVVLAALISFYFLNQPGGPGMSLSNIAAILTAALSILSVSTSALIGFLFRTKKHQ